MYHHIIFISQYIYIYIYIYRYIYILCLYITVSLQINYKIVYLYNEYSPSVCQMDLVLMVDMSGSINASGTNDWQKVINFLTRIVETIEAGDETHVAVVTFSNYAALEFDLNKYTTEAQLIHAIKNINYDVSRRTVSARMCGRIMARVVMHSRA